MKDEKAAGKRKRWWSLDSSADELEDGKPQVAMKKVDVVHLRRVVKRGEKAIRHRSEVLERDKVSEKDLEITREVVERVSEPAASVPVKWPTRKANSFKCFKCGAKISVESVRCPKCDVLYVRDPMDVAEDDGLGQREESPLADGGASLLRERASSFVHFNAVEGTVTCLRNEDGEADFGLECQSCGTVTQLGVERCPICGHDFQEDDSGLMHLLDGLKFDLDNDKEMDCPGCGEHIVIQDGMCPSCKEPLTYRLARAKEVGVLPLLNERDIVFVHLDVLNGQLFFAKKMRFKKSGVMESVHLDSIGNTDFGHDWQGIARI